jgi:hypothetical protein
MGSKSFEILYQDNVIKFIGEITSLKFYNQIFVALTEHYNKSGKSEVPVFSFENVTRFDPKVVPNLIGIGLILKQYHNNAIPLKIINSESIGFLNHINFFKIVGPKTDISENIYINDNRYLNSYSTGLDVFSFDEGFLGFFGNKHEYPKYRKEHKAHVYFNNSYEYYKLYLDHKNDKKIEQLLEEKRTKTYESFVLDKIPKDFGVVLADYIESRDFYNDIIKILSEIVTNAVLYSYSPCIAMLNTNRFKTSISISDFGIGLEGSIKYKPNFNRQITEMFKKKSLYKPQLNDFLLIMDCLSYSKNKERENLWRLKERIKSINGVLRIHYNTTQVVFASRCINCNEGVFECAKCILNSAKEDFDISPLRIYPNTLKGFHIEIEIQNPELVSNNFEIG